MNALSNISYLHAFLGGIALSLTPCVYPLIPITAGYIAGASGGSRLKGFLLSLSYVTGIAVIYSALGLFASLTGSIFGKISSSPITLISVGAVIIIFGLSMLDLFMIPALNFIRPRTPSNQNYLSALFLGLTSGLVISPCLTPALYSILLYLAAKKNIVYGATLLFCFSFGMGLILIVTGTFSSLLASLPKSGKWLLYIKRACAIILLAAGACFVYSGIRNI